MKPLQYHVYLFQGCSNFTDYWVISIHVEGIKDFNELDSCLHEEEGFFGLVFFGMDTFLEDEFGPGDFFVGDRVFFEEGVEVVGGNDLGESIVLLNVFIDLCFVGVGIDFVIAIEFLGEVDHLQQNVELLLIFDFRFLGGGQGHRFVHD